MRTLAKPKILVIDSEANLRLLYETHFALAGYRVVCADNGAMALALVKRERPQAVVLDPDLPDQDGFETLLAIRQEMPDLPLILNASYARHRADLRSFVADAFLIKSSDIDELLSCVTQQLEHSRKTGRVHCPMPLPNPPRKAPATALKRRPRPQIGDTSKSLSQ